MSGLEKCLIKESRLKALFLQQGEKRKFKERTFRTDDVDDLLSQGVTFQALFNLLGQTIQPVVWMGEDAFIRRPPPYLQRRSLGTAPQGFRRLLVLGLKLPINFNITTVYEIDVYGRDYSTNSYSSLLNLLLHLIALDDTIREVELRQPPCIGRSDRPVLPVPPSALERFVCHAQSPPRQLRFVYFSFSEEQGRVLFFQSNPNVLLNPIDLGLLHDRGQSLFDAVASNQSPARLSIEGMTHLSDELFRVFLLGLRGKGTLKKLELNGIRNNYFSQQRMRLFLEALTGNLGLESLDLPNNSLSLSRDDKNWDTLWGAVSHHPCIKCVNVVEGPGAIRLNQEQKVRRTQSIVRALETNIHLNTISYYAGTIVDDELMEKYVSPRLEVNLFRPRIQAIFQEPDQSLRWKLLGRALLHLLPHRRLSRGRSDQQCLQSNLTIRYLLLSKNADLFQSHAPTRADRLTIRWNGVVDRQRLLDEERSALEEEMRETGMPSLPSSSCPPSPPVDDDRSHKNENSKRQRRS